MKQRIIIGLIAGGIFGILCVIGGLPYKLLLLLLAFEAYSEFVRMHRMPTRGVAWWIGFATVAALVSSDASLTTLWDSSSESIVWFSMFLLLGVTVLSKNKISLATVSQLWLGAFYIGIGFKYMMLTRISMGNDGLFWTLMLFACVWSSDIGAYFIGRAVGKIKLWPAISPNKTLEGAIGGGLTSIVVAFLFAAYHPDKVSLPLAVGIGVSAAAVGLTGDLIQSAYKRVCGVKDSGTLLLGHGGILDRCDSWLVMFPFVHLVGLLPL